MPHDALLDAVAAVIADTEKQFSEQLAAIKESIEGTDGIDAALLVYDSQLWNLQETVGTLRVDLDAVRDGPAIVDTVLETLRQDQLDLSESMFAARRRFDSLAEQVETLRGPAGEPGPEGKPGRDGETGEARGLHDPEATYRKLDRVSFNGSEWIARQDDPGPLPGDGWMMGAQRGQRGKPGPAGERGEQGRTGQPGPGISRAEIGDAYDVRFVMDNGAAFAVDLRPLFERYDRERRE